MSAAALLDTLTGLGVRTTVTPSGTLRLEPASCVPADLLAEVRAHKPELLAHLTAKEGTPPPSPSPDLGGQVVGKGDPMPTDCSPEPGTVRTVPAGDSLSPAPDWAALFAQPGHCGSCAHWEAAPDWGSLMGTCTAPPAAFQPDAPPLAIHGGHRCVAWDGQGYRARGEAKP